MMVKEAMTKNPVSLHPDTYLCDAANVMQGKRIGSVLVLEQDELIGIVTERDIIARSVALCRDPKQVKIRDIMSRPVITITEDAEILEASDLMKRHNIRRLAVVNKENKLLGILSTNDIAKSLRRSAEELAITYYLMSREKK